MTEPILKPCPFCGREPFVESENNFHSVGCPECTDNDLKVRVVKFGNPEAVFAVWNNRPKEDALAIEVERLNADNAQLRLENARLMLVGFPTKADYIIRTSNNSNDLEGGKG